MYVPKRYISINRASYAADGKAKATVNGLPTELAALKVSILTHRITISMLPTVR